MIHQMTFGIELVCPDLKIKSDVIKTIGYRGGGGGSYNIISDLEVESFFLLCLRSLFRV